MALAEVITSVVWDIITNSSLSHSDDKCRSAVGQAELEQYRTGRLFDVNDDEGGCHDGQAG